MTFFVISEALLPVFALMLFGAALKRADFPGSDFWPLLDRLNYFVLFPSLLFLKLATARISPLEAVDFSLAVVASLLLQGGLALITGRIVLGPGPALTSLFQCAIRFNTFAGFAAVAALYGDEGMAFAALLTAVLVPVVNTLCVLVLNRHGAAGGNLTHKQQINGFFTNPLIIACLSGILYRLSGWPLPGTIHGGLSLLSSAAIALGLLSVGASLDLRAAGKQWQAGVAGSLLCLIAFPLIMAVLMDAFAITGTSRAVAILWAALPTATSAVILARIMGGDVALMANLITATTLAAMLTMPLMLALLV